jgi:hypothetical protein
MMPRTQGLGLATTRSCVSNLRKRCSTKAIAKVLVRQLEGALMSAEYTCALVIEMGDRRR